MGERGEGGGGGDIGQDTTEVEWSTGKVDRVVFRSITSLPFELRVRSGQEKKKIESIVIYGCSDLIYSLWPHLSPTL